MLLIPVPKHLVIKKKISICGSGVALLKLDVWRGWGCGGQGSFRWLGWGESTGFDQWVSDVVADSFRGKLQGLTPLVPGMLVFWFSFLDRHSSNMLLNTIVGCTLDSRATSPPLTLSAPLQGFDGGVPFLWLLGRAECCSASKSLWQLVCWLYTSGPSLTLCFEPAPGCCLTVETAERLDFNDASISCT